VWVGSNPATFVNIASMAPGRRRPRLHRRPESAQEQDGRRLAGLVGGFPVPGAGGVGSAEGRFHRRAENAGIDALPAFEMGKKPPGRANDGGSRIGNDGKRKGRDRRSGTATEEAVMMGPQGERGMGMNHRKRSLSPCRFKPFPDPLSLSGGPSARTGRPSPVNVYSLRGSLRPSLRRKS